MIQQSCPALWPGVWPWPRWNQFISSSGVWNRRGGGHAFTSIRSCRASHHLPDAASHCSPCRACPVLPALWADPAVSLSPSLHLWDSYPLQKFQVKEIANLMYLKWVTSSQIPPERGTPNSRSQIMGKYWKPTNNNNNTWGIYCSLSAMHYSKYRLYYYAYFSGEKTALLLVNLISQKDLKKSPWRLTVALENTPVDSNFLGLNSCSPPPSSGTTDKTLSLCLILLNYKMGI